MSAKTSVINFVASFFDIVAPPRRTEVRVRHLSGTVLHALSRRHLGERYAPEIHSLLPYRHKLVKALIFELKYRQNPQALGLAGELLKEELTGASEDMIALPLLMPVPMHRERLSERSINPPELLCEYIMAGGHMTLEYTPQALSRTKHSRPQQQLPRKERLVNMKNAIAAQKTLVQGRHCIVLDDVTTTGATLTECRRVLKKAGAKSVHLIALAG
jgi:ComF family protein